MSDIKFPTTGQFRNKRKALWKLDFKLSRWNEYWFLVFWTVCEVNFPTTFREPLWVPKRRLKIRLAHRTKTPKETKISTFKAVYKLWWWKVQIFESMLPSLLAPHVGQQMSVLYSLSCKPFCQHINVKRCHCATLHSNSGMFVGKVGTHVTSLSQSHKTKRHKNMSGDLGARNTKRHLLCYDVASIAVAVRFSDVLTPSDGKEQAHLLSGRWNQQNIHQDEA